MDWQIKMNHGKPDISVCKETESCLHLKSVRSSFALEHSVDVDPAQMPFLDLALEGGATARAAAISAAPPPTIRLPKCWWRFPISAF